MKWAIAFVLLAGGCGQAPTSSAPPAALAPVESTYASELDSAIALAKQAEQVIKALEANKVTVRLDPSAGVALQDSSRELSAQLARLDNLIEESAGRLRGLRTNSPEFRGPAAVDFARWRQIGQLANAELTQLEAAMKAAQDAQAMFDREYGTATPSERANAEATRSSSAMAIRNGLVKIGETRAAAMYADRMLKIYAD